MAKQLTFSGFMIPLDILLDTRMGTIGKMNLELAGKLNTHAYRNRQNDDFEGISREEFKAAYAKRDVETLQHSLVTAFPPVLRRIVQEMALGDGTEFHPEMPRIYINTWPYQLAEEELTELGLIMASILNTPFVEIELINKSLEELTPEYCLDMFKFMAMYLEYNAWLDLHRFALHKNSMEHVVLFAPAMYDNAIPTAARIEETMKTVGLHPIEMHEQTAKEMIDLTLIDVKYFSVIEVPLPPDDEDEDDGDAMAELEPA